MNWYLAKLGSLDEKRACPSHPQNLQNPFKRGFDGFEGWCDDRTPPAWRRSARHVRLTFLRIGGVKQSRTRRRSSAHGADKPRRSAGRRVSCSAYTPRLSDRWQAIGD